MARVRKSKSELLPQADPTAPLDVGAFLAAAQPVLAELTEDLLARADADAGITAALKKRHEFERKQQRTADAYEVWRRNVVVQIAAGWLLSCVFVRTLEDRGLLGRNRIAGPGAVDSQEVFHRLAPHLGEREYLLSVFREMERFPATRGLFDREHNLAWRLGPSAQAAKSLLAVFRAGDPEAPAFRFGQPSTRFLGDLYQDLSEDVRKRYALLQTPDFIEAFILDRTLDPAIEEFGLAETTVIDPTCGSGHFLLGAFERLYDRWCSKAPNDSAEQTVERALGSVFGVDINPYAVAIARFRLTLAAMEKLEVRQIAKGPSLPLNVVVADSLLHNYTRAQMGFGDLLDQTAATWYGDAFALDDEWGAKNVLNRRFAAVVGNPPYITVKDKVLRDRYRELYSAAHREYSLSVPFMQRFFDCARPGGFVGQITSNSFMKREFGSLLIEKYLPTQDVHLIVNTSGAHIPGHGTPTVMVFGRTQTPEREQVSVVLARRGEPSAPEDPAQGLVWRSIEEHWGDQGFENEYITVGTVARAELAKHPWCLAGGRVLVVKAYVEAHADHTLAEIVAAIGFSVITGEDNVFLRSQEALLRAGIPRELIRRDVVGEEVRDWAIADGDWVVWPNGDTGHRRPAKELGTLLIALWRYRVALKARKAFGVAVEKKGIPWWALREVYHDRMRTPLTIGFAFVATHNHFVLDRGGKVFNRTAPIIKLPDTATEGDHLALLAYLNSSTACFWMKQVFFDKGATAEKNSEQAKTAFEFSVTQLGKLPIVTLPKSSHGSLVALAGTISRLAATRARLIDECLPFGATDIDASQLSARIASAALEDAALLGRMVFLQDELDWLVYETWGLAPATTDACKSLAHPDERLPIGSRPSEVFTARMGVQHGVDGQLLYDQIPQCVSGRVRALVERRVELIGGDEQLQLLEDPQYKRRWWIPRVELGGGRGETFDSRVHRHCDMWLCRRIEQLAEVLDTIFSTNELVQRALRDDCMAAVAEFQTVNRDGTVTSALATESVPFLAALRHTDRGLEKHAAWRRTWNLQRREDAGEKVGKISVPPKYDQKDFRTAEYYHLRGKLDVPKERFISYPGCESDKDHDPVYGWAGWNHLQRAQALATLYRDRKTNEAWLTERLIPMLAGVLELLPWLKQWHNEPHPEFGPQGDFFEDWLDGELREHKLIRADLEAWRPTSKSGREKASKKTSAKRKSPELLSDDDSAPAIESAPKKRVRKKKT